MIRLIGVVGALYGGLAVAAGAFGAHALKGRLPPELLAHWATATDYLALHALALVVTGVLLESAGANCHEAAGHTPENVRPCRDFHANRPLRLAGAAFALGGCLFSGSLYVRVLLDMPSWGMVTPLGGSLLILGWLLLALGLWRRG